MVTLLLLLLLLSSLPKPSLPHQMMRDGAA
jgi:hypothetical protein